MRISYKGTALAAAIGMVFGLAVAAPTNAAQADRPQNVVVTSGRTFAVVEFDVPNGNATDLRYKTYNNGSSNTADVRSFYAPDAPPATIEAGHYLFVLQAADITGDRLEVATVTPDNINWDVSWNSISVNPSAPGDMAASASDMPIAGHIAVTIESVSDLADSYEYSTDLGFSWAAAPAAVDGVVDIADQSAGGALATDGTTYPVWMRGVNASGKSLPADAGTATPYVVPGAPVIATSPVEAGNGSLTVELLAPAASNGRELTGYVWSTDGGATAGGEATVAACASDAMKTCITARGLPNKVAVAQLWFAGVNLRGTGAWSADTIAGTPIIRCSTIPLPAVKFAVSKSTLTNAAKSRLRSFASAVNQSDCTSLSLQAHRVIVKKSGVNRVRLALGIRRAAAVKTYLVGQGVTIPITTSVVSARDNRTVYAQAVALPA